MPTPPSDAPLTRTSLNLYTEDVDKLKRAYGPGWTAKVRELVKAFNKGEIVYGQTAHNL